MTFLLLTSTSSLARAAATFWKDIIDEFCRRTPRFLDLCQSLKVAIVNPIFDNRPNDLPQPVTLALSKVDSNGGVLDRLLEACGPATENPRLVVEEADAEAPQ